jgi:hypothetical protein
MRVKWKSVKDSRRRLLLVERTGESGGRAVEITGHNAADTVT